MSAEQIIAVLTVLFLVYSYGFVMTVADGWEKAYFTIIFPLGIVGVILGGVIG